MSPVPANSKPAAFAPLDIKPIRFSLTEGTDIPEPQESPPSTPARPPTPGGGPLSSHPTSPQDSPEDPMGNASPKIQKDDVNGANGDLRGRNVSVATANTNTSKHDSPNDKNMLSPTVSKTESSAGKRASSVRRFLGFRSASSADSLRSNQPPNRPESPSGSFAPSARPSVRERRKSASWFGKRASTMFGIGSLPEGYLPNGDSDNNPSTTTTTTTKGQPPVPPQKKGPPPPTLPELHKLGSGLDGGAFDGDDMFKNIK
ncbi:uncharacterized protein J3D65DRAFT_31863 [Phyllosticta citribraziliensis]|uniref:Uncharacterized protein n=1 Tax=Phyllosticta citribraziliensis TaxID=989973 RepID=A0ABR1MCZ0_9PEZI